ncbi:MAG: D-2-hydroxyacid dehydrogenase [Clostridia bacterium]|nr:D-2-hydroxyacid dehydrogenase [Clostridia bacterium]
MKILITDYNSLIYNNDVSLDVFNKFGEVVLYESINRNDLLKEVEDVDVILSNKVTIDNTVFNKAPKLKYIGLFATGYNNIDIKSAKSHGVTVCNAGSYSTDAVAQQVFSYILSYYTKVESYDRLVKSGAWITSPTFSMMCYPTDELSNKTIGIIGYGSIGKRVSVIANAFGMNVLVYTRTPKSDDTVKFVDLKELLSLSDIVTVHCPLTEQSRNMFNDKTFGIMKDGAVFINTSRGGVVEEKALFDALKSGKLSYAAVDVLNKEPMDKDCILKNAKNIMITPHTCWVPLATRKRLINIVSDNLTAFLNGTPINVVS